MPGNEELGSGASSPKVATSPMGKKGSGSSSPTGGSPAGLSPGPSNTADILPAQHWVQAAEEEAIEPNDAASIAESIATSTNSLTSSILNYRKIHGRTYHSDIGNAAYWGANDEKQSESMDINHHVLTLLLDGKLFLAPLETDRIQNVLDIGTGTGSWASDFADDHPEIEVIGTDISPIQPGWVPPNLKFEIEDCTREWTFQSDSMDYVHMRLLVGSIADWEALFVEAFRTLKPGGWVESNEGFVGLESDDGSIAPTSALGQWPMIFADFGDTIGHSFSVVPDGMQRKAMEAAGFVDIEEFDFKVPVGNWPKDPKLKEIGTYTQFVFEADPEGYILYPATALGWSPEEATVFAAHARRELRSSHIHGYYRRKLVYGRKPLQ